VWDDATGQKRGFQEQWNDFREYFGQWKHAKVLFATAAAWFLL
jgi:PHS family inorganic phosphate transporter-like MFS transporter